MFRKIRYTIQLLALFAFLLLLRNNALNVWLIIFSAGVALSLVFGRLYCGWLCPINTLLQPLNWLAARFKRQRRPVPAGLRSGGFAWLLLAGSSIAMIAGRKLEVRVPLLPYLALLAVALSWWFKPEVWHKYLCPFGVLQQITGKFARVSQRIDQNRCTGCLRCQAACPAEAIATSREHHTATIDPAHCLQCFDCQSACHRQAIAYRPENTRVTGQYRDKLKV